MLLTMLPLAEISQAIKTRRSDMGLTQSRVASLSGLSRVTINQIENGTIKDLSLTRTARLLDALGLTLEISPARPDKAVARRQTTPALVLAARTASVSYRAVLPPELLRSALLGHEIPLEFQPHLNTLLEEASVALLSRLVDELHKDSGIAPAELWARMRSTALSLGSRRELWT